MLPFEITKPSKEKGDSDKKCVAPAWNSTSVGLLICTLISENPGLKKSRSVSNLRKISGFANLDFFQGLHLRKKLGLYYKLEKNPGDKLYNLAFFLGGDLEKKIQVCRT